MSKVQMEISRVTRSREEARANYNRYSRMYDLFSWFERNYRNLGLQILAVQEGEKVLEIGYGTGTAIIPLAKSVGPAGQVIGIDISDGMQAISEVRVRKAGLTSRVKLYREDALKLPFDRDTFHAIFMSFTLELFDTPEIPLILKQCRRVLREGGRLCVVSLSKRETQSLMVRIYEWLHDRFPALMDCRPIYVQQALMDAKFTIIKEAKMSMWGLPVDVVLAQR